MHHENRRKTLAWIGTGLIAASIICISCREQPAGAGSMGDPVLQARAERDMAFRQSPQSPIPERDRARFQRLSYYPVNENLRFRVQLIRYPTPARITMVTNTGEIREGLRYGYFEFRAEGQTCRLQVYRLDESTETGQPYLFIPFRDASTGKETYAAGRYLDFPENTSGTYDLDFNRAYNPSCAYGEAFSCPIPPEDNHLQIWIRAGEKMYLH